MVASQAARQSAPALDVTALGLRVRKERIGGGQSLEELADRAGVSRSMLSAVERGTKVPTVTVLPSRDSIR